MTLEHLLCPHRHNRNHEEIHEESLNHSHIPEETLDNLDSGNDPSPMDELGEFHPSGIWLCETCGKDFSSCEDLDDHMEKVHSDHHQDSDEPSQL